MLCQQQICLRKGRIGATGWFVFCFFNRYLIFCIRHEGMYWSIQLKHRSVQLDSWTQAVLLTLHLSSSSLHGAPSSPPCRTRWSDSWGSPKKLFLNSDELNVTGPSWAGAPPFGKWKDLIGQAWPPPGLEPRAGVLVTWHLEGHAAPTHWSKCPWAAWPLQPRVARPPRT